MADRFRYRSPNASDHCVDCGTPRSQTTRLTRDRCGSCYRKHVRALKKSGIFEPLPPASVKERLLSRVQIAPNGCHLWTGVINAWTGYGTMGLDGYNPYVHRLAYTLFVGPIPQGMKIDHVCHNRDTECRGEGMCMHRRCLNPDHLEAVPHRENLVRSPLTLAGRNVLKTHCKRGHEFTSENTIARSNGARKCRSCHNQAQRAASARRRAARQAAKKAA